MPFPNEHAVRLRRPGDFDKDSFRRTHGSGDGLIQGVKVPKTIDVIWAKLKGKAEPEDPVIAQALRFPTKKWTETAAREWLKDNKVKFIRFEPATDQDDEEESSMKDGVRLQEFDARSFMMRANAGLVVEREQFAAADGETVEKRTFTMLANTGKPMDMGWFGPTILDHKSLKIPHQDIPALRDHDDEKIVGFTEKITKSKDGLKAKGVFLDPESNAHAAEIIDFADQGYPWQCSVYIPPGKIERIYDDEVVTVNGQKLTGPLTIFREAVLREVTFCALGADDDTRGAAAAGGHQITVEVHDKEGALMADDKDKKKGEEEEQDPVVPAAGDETPPAEDPPAEDPPAEDPPAEEASVKLAVKAERERIGEITKLAASLGLSDLADQFIKDGTTVKETELALSRAKLAALRAEAPASTGGGAEQMSVTPDELAALPAKERAEAEWKKDAELRKEFGTVERYEAYLKADAAGLVEVSGSRR